MQMLYLLCWIAPLVFILLGAAFIWLMRRSAAQWLPEGIDMRIGRLRRADIAALDSAQDAALRRAVGRHAGMAIALSCAVSTFFTALYGTAAVHGVGMMVACILCANLIGLGAGLAAMLTVIRPANAIWRDLHPNTP